MLAEQAPKNAAARRLGLKQCERIVEGERLRIGPLWDRGVDFAVIDVGAEAALLDDDRAALRMLAENATRPAAAETRCPRAGLLGDDEVDRPVGADLQHLVVAAQIRVSLAVLHVGAITP